MPTAFEEQPGGQGKEDGREGGRQRVEGRARQGGGD